MSRLTAYIAALGAIQDQVQALVDDLQGNGLPADEYSQEPVPEPEPIPDPVPDPIPDPAPAPVPTPTPVPIPPIIGATVAVNESDLVAKVANAAPGSKIGMKDGRWNNVALSGNDVDVVAENPGAAIFDAVRVFKSNNVRVHNFTVRPKGDTLKASNNVNKFGFQSDATASATGLFGCRVYSHDDSAGHFNWTKAQWLKRMMGGVGVYGSGCTIDQFYMEGGHFGVALIGPNNTASNVRLCGISGDGGRINNSGNAMRRCYFSDFVLVDQNHADGIQAFGKLTNGKYSLIDGVELSELVILEHTQNPLNPLRANGNAGMQPFGVMQVLGFHNGPYANVNIDRVLGATGAKNGLKMVGVNGLTANQVEMYNIYTGTPQGTKSNFAAIDIRGANIKIGNSQSDAWLNSAASSLGQNGNINGSYPIVQPQWAVDLIASLPN